MKGENETNRFRNCGGPHNLGDPDDKHLRKVEKDVLIPQLMRDKAKQEKCVKEVAEFSKCCKNHNIFMVYKCQEQNAALKDCLGLWYNNSTFREACTQEYLEERSRYRRTGIPKRSKHARMLSTST